MSQTIVCNKCGVEYGSTDELKPIVIDDKYNDTVLEEDYECPNCKHNDFSVITQENPRWDDDSIQFPRLLAEIVANVVITNDDFGKIASAMDLEFDDVAELFDRAQKRWEEIKAECK